MSETDLSDEVTQIVADVLRVDESDLSADTAFDEDVEAESLDYVEIAETIEVELGVEVPDEDLEEFETVGDVQSYVAAHE